MRKILFIALTVSVLYGCNNRSNSGGTAGDESTKYLASNIVFSSADASSLKTQAIDSSTKILAKNVLLDTATLGIGAANVQEAFNETSPDLSQSIVGKWKILEIASGASMEAVREDGTITFNADLSFSIDGYSDPTGSNNRPLGLIEFYAMKNPTAVLNYSIIGSSVISFQIKSNNEEPLVSSDSMANTYPLLLFKITPDEISLLGNNGNIAVLVRE